MPRRQTQKRHGGTTPEMSQRTRSRSSTRSRSKSPNNRQTKKLKFHEKLVDVKEFHIDTPEYKYRHWDDDEVEKHRRTLVANLQKCPDTKLEINEDGEYEYIFSKNARRYPCVHRGVIFEDAEEYSDYYNGRAKSVNLGNKTAKMHYQQFRGLQPSASKRRKMQNTNANFIQQR